MLQYSDNCNFIKHLLKEMAWFVFFPLLDLITFTHPLCYYFSSFSTSLFPQPGLTEENLSQPSSAVSLPTFAYLRPPLTSDMTFDSDAMTSEPKFKSHSEYGSPGVFSHSLGLPPGMDSYGQQQQSYSGPDVAMATSDMASTSLSQESPYLYSTTCLRYRHPPARQSGASVAATSTVITHTGSTINVLPQDPPQSQSYPSLPDMIPQSTCVSLGYQPMSVAPPTEAPPMPGYGYCFSVPQQVGRGKRKQKTGGPKVFPTPVAASPTPPTQTSCLAKLLSSTSQERMFLYLIYLFILICFLNDLMQQVSLFFLHSV